MLCGAATWQGDVTVPQFCCSAPNLGRAQKRLIIRNSLYSKNSGTVEQWCNAFSNDFSNDFSNAGGEPAEGILMMRDYTWGLAHTKDCCLNTERQLSLKS